MNNLHEELLEELARLQDAEYAAFMRKLLPTVAPERVVGVRTPALRQLAKGLVKQGVGDEVLRQYEERYAAAVRTGAPLPPFEEGQVCAFIISVMKDAGQTLRALEGFLPTIDNWATCDQCSPVAFRRNPAAVLPALEGWIVSPQTYTVRFAIGMLMAHFLDDAFELRFLQMVASVQSEEYYINMMRAWYFATALAKQWDATVGLLRDGALDVWTHNKTIQKARESRRITPEQKAYLKTLRR